MFKEFKTRVEELGKKFGAELYSFSYNSNGGSEVESDWDVKYAHVDDKFEEGWNILDMIALGDDSSAVENKRIGTVHIYEPIDENFSKDFFILEITDWNNRLGIVEVKMTKCLRNPKHFKATLKREDIENIKTWQGLIDRVVLFK